MFLSCFEMLATLLAQYHAILASCVVRASAKCRLLPVDGQRVEIRHHRHMGTLSAGMALGDLLRPLHWSLSHWIV